MQWLIRRCLGVIVRHRMHRPRSVCRSCLNDGREINILGVSSRRQFSTVNQTHAQMNHAGRTGRQRHRSTIACGPALCRNKISIHLRCYRYAVRHMQPVGAIVVRCQHGFTLSVPVPDESSKGDIACRGRDGQTS